MFNTPILFIIFNRPDVTARVFAEIRKAKPKQLFVVADGPRDSKIGEKDKCEVTRRIIEAVDWDCEVRKDFSDVNLGCKIRVSTGISWFFTQVESGIILEDDCLPDQSFFYFCQNLLERYKNDERVMMISGDNFQFGQTYGAGSYYFSKFCHIWGWASWRRAWDKYDVAIKTFPEFKAQNKIKDLWSDEKIQEHWLNIFQKVYDNQIDTWDYQWTYSVWQQNGLAIIPNVNLISNIGFGAEATHTKREGLFSEMPSHSLNDIIHPTEVKLNKAADDHYCRKYFRMGLLKRVTQFLWAKLRFIFK